MLTPIVSNCRRLWQIPKKRLPAYRAYVGEYLDKQLREQKKVIPQTIEKGFKNKSLTKHQITSDNEKYRTRVRVEHIYGFVENSMNGSYIRSVGITRAKGIIGLMNLTYNLFRKIQIT